MLRSPSGLEEQVIQAISKWCRFADYTACFDNRQRVAFDYHGTFHGSRNGDHLRSQPSQQGQHAHRVGTRTVGCGGSHYSDH